MDYSLPGSSVHGDSPGKNTGVDCHALPTQGSNPGLLYCRRILYHLSHQGNPRILAWVNYSFLGNTRNGQCSVEAHGIPHLSLIFALLLQLSFLSILACLERCVGSKIYEQRKKNEYPRSNLSFSSKKNFSIIAHKWDMITSMLQSTLRNSIILSALQNLNTRGMK